MKKNLRFAFALMLALVLMTALSVPAFAADTDIFALDGTDGSYDGSLFVAGQNVDSRADVQGVLMAAGYDVRAGGKSEYVMAAGSTAEFFGAAENDVFLAGSTVVVTGRAGRDVFIVGNTIAMGGVIGRGAYIVGDTVKLTGSIGGDVYINANKLVISDTADIPGTVRVNENASISYPASVNVVTYVDSSSSAPAAAKPANTLGHKLGSWALSFLGVTAVAFVLLWLTPLWETVDLKYYGAPFSKYAKAFGIGFAVLVGLPVAVVLLMIARVGVRLAFVLTGVYLASIAAAPVFLGFFLGALIWRRLFKKAPNYFAELPIGILLWRIAYCIPGLSFAVGLVAVPLGLGVVTLLLGKHKAAPAETADAPAEEPSALPEAEPAPALPEKSEE